MPATTASPRCLSRPLTTTNAPSPANADAMATPRPPVEPVTSAVRPASRVLFGLMSPHAPLHENGPASPETDGERAQRPGSASSTARQQRSANAASTATTLDDIRARTQTSKSQLFHYFPDGKDQLLLAVAEQEAQTVLDDQQPHLGALTSWAAWQRWRDAVVDRYRRQGQHCPLGVLMSEIGRTTPGAQAVTSALIRAVARRDRRRRTAHAGPRQGLGCAGCRPGRRRNACRYPGWRRDHAGDRRARLPRGGIGRRNRVAAPPYPSASFNRSTYASTSPIADSAACTLTAMMSPIPCTPCVSPIMGDKPG